MGPAHDAGLQSIRRRISPKPDMWARDWPPVAKLGAEMLWAASNWVARRSAGRHPVACSPARDSARHWHRTGALRAKTGGAERTLPRFPPDRATSAERRALNRPVQRGEPAAGAEAVESHTKRTRTSGGNPRDSLAPPRTRSSRACVFSAVGISRSASWVCKPRQHARPILARNDRT